MGGDGLEDYLEGRERMDLIKTAQPRVELGLFARLPSLSIF
jgi:hypothetical protein